MMPGAFTSTRLRSAPGDRALAVDRLAEPVDHAAEQRLADRHVHDAAGARDGVAFADLLVVAEDDDADVVGFQVQHHAAQAGAGELHHLAGHDVLQAEDAGDAVADGQHLAGLGDVGLGVERGDLLLQDLRDLGWADLHLRRLPSWRTAGAAGGISAGVVEAGADPHDQAAEQVGFDRFDDVDVAVAGLDQAGAQLLCAARRSADGRRRRGR